MRFESAITRRVEYARPTFAGREDSAGDLEED